jgi:hypothetical protein
MATRRIIALSRRAAFAQTVCKASGLNLNLSSSQLNFSLLKSFPKRAFSSAASGVTDVKVPGMGDSITNGTIVSWQKRK